MPVVPPLVLPVPLVELSVPPELGEADGVLEGVLDESELEEELGGGVVGEVDGGLDGVTLGVVVVVSTVLRSHAARPSAVTTARGIIQAFIVRS